MIVGEIGRPRRELLYDYQYWEIICIINGYRQRERTTHILTRLQTFWMVKCSMANSDKITSPRDLWKLPWDNEEQEPTISEEDQNDLLDMMSSLNKKAAK